MPGWTRFPVPSQLDNKPLIIMLWEGRCHAAILRWLHLIHVSLGGSYGNIMWNSIRSNKDCISESPYQSCAFFPGDVQILYCSIDSWCWKQPQRWWDLPLSTLKVQLSKSLQTDQEFCNGTVGTWQLQEIKRKQTWCVYGSQTKLNNYLNPVFRAAFERIPTLFLQGLGR